MSAPDKPTSLTEAERGYLLDAEGVSPFVHAIIDRLDAQSVNQYEANLELIVKVAALEARVVELEQFIGGKEAFDAAVHDCKLDREAPFTIGYWIERVRKAEAELAEAREQIARLEAALEKSIELQSHYAMLLNAYDGGKRMEFPSAQAWLERLAALRGETP